MNTWFSKGMVMMLGSVCLSLRAAGPDLPLMACEAALKEQHGDTAVLKLVSKRKSRQGTLLKISVRQQVAGSDNWQVLFENCLVARQRSQQPSTPGQHSEQVEILR